eukprot:7389591-Prymnesium_polylepis.1
MDSVLHEAPAAIDHEMCLACCSARMLLLARVERMLAVLSGSKQLALERALLWAIERLQTKIKALQILPRTTSLADELKHCAIQLHRCSALWARAWKTLLPSPALQSRD